MTQVIDQIIRSSRKTIAIVVHSDGKVVVRAPLKASKAQIELFINSKLNWIEQARARLEVVPQLTTTRHFVQDELFLFLGNQHPLNLNSKTGDHLVLDASGFHLNPKHRSKGAEIFKNWYIAQAREFISQRVAWYANKHHFNPVKIRITSARTRWGSCSSKGTLSFTWRLVMCPPEVIDYVVVHELVHLVERNHAARFWAKVEDILPDYKQRRKWLKTNGAQINLK